MKTYFYFFFALFLISCADPDSSAETFSDTTNENSEETIDLSVKDFFSYEIQLPDGTVLTKLKEFDSQRSIACYNRLKNESDPCILIGFPYGQDNFTLSLTASKPGTYELPKTEICKSELVIQHFGVVDGKSEVKEFRAKDLKVQIEKIVNRDEEGAKSLIGQSGDGYSSIQGSFSGRMTYTLNGTELEDCSISGKFRSFDVK